MSEKRILLTVCLFCIALVLPPAGYTTTIDERKKSLPPKTCQPMQDNWLFCEDFEYGNHSAWAPRDPDGYLKLRTVNNQDPVSGNTVLQVRLPPGRGGNGLRKRFTLNDYKVLYARWYVKYEPGFDFSALNHGLGLRAGNRWSPGSGHRPAGDDYITVRLEHLTEPSINKPVHYLYVYYRGMKMDCSDPEGACWGDHFPCMVDEDNYCKRAPRETVLPPVLKHDQWYCVEMMVDVGNPASNRETADGRLDFWVNDQQIGPWNGLWLRTHKRVRLNSFWLGLFHHAEHSKEGLLFDDVVISKSRIGCHR